MLIFALYTIYYNFEVVGGTLKMKKFGFFSLGDLFIGNGMGKSTSEINPNTFGNMAHPRDLTWSIVVLLTKI